MSAHSDQVDRVRASLLAPITAETHHDVYARRMPRVVAVDPISVEAVSESIRDLGVLLAASQTVEGRVWLVLRLRNRLDALDALLVGCEGGS